MLVKPLLAMVMVGLCKTHYLVCIATILKRFWFSNSSKITKKEQKNLFFALFRHEIIHTALKIPKNTGNVWHKLEYTCFNP